MIFWELGFAWFLGKIHSVMMTQENYEVVRNSEMTGSGFGLGELKFKTDQRQRLRKKSMTVKGHL